MDPAPAILTEAEAAVLDAFVAEGLHLAPAATAGADPDMESQDSGPLTLSASEWLVWASSPAVKDSIAQIRDLVTLSLELRITRERDHAVSVLAEVSRTSADPVERRRAASAILRGPWSATGLPPRSARTSASPRSGWHGQAALGLPVSPSPGANLHEQLNSPRSTPPTSTTIPGRFGPSSPGPGLHHDLNSPRPTPPTSLTSPAASASSPGPSLHNELKSPRPTPPASIPNGGFQGGSAPMASAPPTKPARHQSGALPDFLMSPSLSLALAAGAAPDTS